jgi:hypothetical protein
MGVFRILFPEQVISKLEQKLLLNPEECTLKPWAVSAARIEGLCYLFIAWRGEALYSWFKKLHVVIGLVLLFFPHQLLKYSGALIYQNPKKCEWNQSLYPVIRLSGMAYILIALKELRK